MATNPFAALFPTTNVRTFGNSQHLTAGSSSSSSSSSSPSFDPSAFGSFWNPNDRKSISSAATAATNVAVSLPQLSQQSKPLSVPKPKNDAPAPRPSLRPTSAQSHAKSHVQGAGTLWQFFQQKQQAQKPLDTILSNVYWIARADLLPDDDRWNVTATPLDTSGKPGEPYPLFVCTPTHVGLPRFFGQDAYGPPRIVDLSHGLPLSDDASHFAWTLQNTPQKPQRDALAAWRAAGRVGQLVMPCGAGKTVVGFAAISNAKCRAAILVHNESLMQQWVERGSSCMPHARMVMIQGKKRSAQNADIAVVMIQTLFNMSEEELRLGGFHDVGMVIVDECHHIAARTFCTAMMKLKPRYLLGLSATPKRRDGLTHVLGWLLGPVVFSCARCDVVPQTIWQIEYTQGNQRVVKYKNGQVGVPTMTNTMVKDPARNRLIHITIRHVMNDPNTNKCLVLSARREHLQVMQNIYGQRYDCGLYLGGMKPAELEESKHKRLIFASYNMAQEFLDIDGLNRLIMATPCPANAEQVIGRLRESQAPCFENVPVAQEAEYEERVRTLLEKWLVWDELTDCVVSYLKKKVDRSRVVYDIVDAFDLFLGMSYKRRDLYKRLCYKTERLSQFEFERMIQAKTQ